MHRAHRSSLVAASLLLLPALRRHASTSPTTTTATATATASPSLADRQAWCKKRFGNLKEGTLGDLATVKPMVWPGVTMEVEGRDGPLTYRPLTDIEAHAERVAELYRNGIDEMNGNGDYVWHHDPAEIVARTRGGDWLFHGCFWQGHLISVSSLYMIRGQRAVQWVWGVTDPNFRGKGCWKPFGSFVDKVIEASGAQMGIVWAVSTHKLTQMSAENIGMTPVGCFLGSEFLGGSDGKYYRQNVIWYNKLYGPGREHMQAPEDMLLTGKAARLAETVLGIHTEQQPRAKQ